MSNGKCCCLFGDVTIASQIFACVTALIGVLNFGGVFFTDMSFYYWIEGGVFLLGFLLACGLVFVAVHFLFPYCMLPIIFMMILGIGGLGALSYFTIDGYFDADNSIIFDRLKNLNNTQQWFGDFIQDTYNDDLKTFEQNFTLYLSIAAVVTIICFLVFLGTHIHTLITLLDRVELRKASKRAAANPPVQTTYEGPAVHEAWDIPSKASATPPYILQQPPLVENAIPSTPAPAPVTAATVASAAPVVPVHQGPHAHLYAAGPYTVPSTYSEYDPYGKGSTIIMRF